MIKDEQGHCFHVFRIAMEKSDEHELLQTNVHYGLQPRSGAESERISDADLLCRSRQRVYKSIWYSLISHYHIEMQNNKAIQKKL